MTPTEVDTELERLYIAGREEQNLLAQTIGSVHHLAGDKQANRHGGRGRRWGMTLAECEARLADPEFEPPLSMRSWGKQTYLAKLANHREKLAQLDAEAAPFEAQYEAKRWSRFFVVTKGHIHSSMHCSTCNNGEYPTEFGWLPELSGLTEADAVKVHGPLLCTVCFPSAPVEWTNFYELESEAKASTKCQGSGTYEYDRATARTGFYSGNWGQCDHCKARITLTKTNKMRAHDKAKEDGTR